jgi:hypothetical protein
MSATRLRNTCFPMQLFPTNFFDILIGSQFKSFERKFRKVVPSVSGRSPDLNSLIRRLAYASSSAVHLPRRSGCPPFFLDGAPSPPPPPPPPPPPEEPQVLSGEGGGGGGGGADDDNAAVGWETTRCGAMIAAGADDATACGRWRAAAAAAGRFDRGWTADDDGGGGSGRLLFATASEEVAAAAATTDDDDVVDGGVVDLATCLGTGRGSSCVTGDGVLSLLVAVDAADDIEWAAEEEEGTDCGAGGGRGDCCDGALAVVSNGTAADDDDPVWLEVPAATVFPAIAFCCVGLAPGMVGFAVVLTAVAEMVEAVAGGLEEGDDDDDDDAAT